MPPRPYRLSTLAHMSNRLLNFLGYSGAIDIMGVSWGGALAQQFAHLFPERCRRLVLASTSPGSIMVPGKPSVLFKMINPRRYTDSDYFRKVGGDLYGGAYRRNPALLRDHSRHIQPPRGLGYFYQLLGAWGPALAWIATPTDFGYARHRRPNRASDQCQDSCRSHSQLEALCDR